jgi:hypothetical protein
MFGVIVMKKWGKQLNCLLAIYLALQRNSPPPSSRGIGS